ncbi:MAG: hypothetical protein Q9224_007321, partial [Gallowayella concinna]
MTELYKQAQSRIPATISLPSHWLKSYENFVTKNATSVGQIESALRSLIYLIPGIPHPFNVLEPLIDHPSTGRFREAELASETRMVTLLQRSCCIHQLNEKPVHTSTLLLSLYHTSLLRRHFPSPFPPSPQTRYTAFYTARSRLYSNSALLLQTVQYTELLCEMFFKRRGGEKARWRLVVMLEVIKAICRTIMFWITGRRTVVESMGGAERPQIPEPHTEEMTESGSVVAAAGEEEEEPNVMEERSKEWFMPRTGMKLPVLPTKGNESITEFLAKRVISADDIKIASQLVRRIGSYQGQFAEMMWIARPVVYA